MGGMRAALGFGERILASTSYARHVLTLTLKAASPQPRNSKIPIPSFQTPIPRFCESVNACGQVAVICESSTGAGRSRRPG